jgi:hypothetical protein
MNAYHLGALYAGVALTLFLPVDGLKAQAAAALPPTARTTIFAGSMQHCSSLNLCATASLPALGQLAALQGGTTSLSLQAGQLTSLLADVQMGGIQDLGDQLKANIDIEINALDTLGQNIALVQTVASGIGPTRISAGAGLAQLDIASIETGLGLTPSGSNGSWQAALTGAVALDSLTVAGNPLAGHFAPGTKIPVSGPITLPAINLGPLSLGSQQQLFTGTMTVQQPSQVVDPADSDFLIQSVVPLLISGVAPDGLGGAYTIEFRIGETAIRKSLIGAGGVRISPATITFDPTGLAGLTILPPTH